MEYGESELHLSYLYITGSLNKERVKTEQPEDKRAFEAGMPKQCAGSYMTLGGSVSSCVCHCYGPIMETLLCMH
jgi:hypothetical protein